MTSRHSYILGLVLSVFVVSCHGMLDEDTRNALQPEETSAPKESSSNDGLAEFEGVPPPISKSVASNVNGFPTPPNEQPLSVFPNSACLSCKHLIHGLAERVLRLQSNRQDVVIHAQTLCQEDSLAGALRVQCNVYQEVEEWLATGGMLGEHVDVADMEKHPEKFCIRKHLCGVAAPSEADDNPSNGKPDKFGAVAVRMKLKENVTSINTKTTQWATFVKKFLSACARRVEINPDRLQMHRHPGDKVVEMIILRSYHPHLADNAIVKSAVQSAIAGHTSVLNDSLKTEEEAAEAGAKAGGELGEAAGALAGREAGEKAGLAVLTSPLEVARRFRSLMSPQSNAPERPWEILANVDMSYPIQIVPLLIPPTIPTEEEPAPQEEPTVDCEKLRDNKNLHCGLEGWKCTKDCERAFTHFFGSCEAKRLNEQEHERVWSTFKDYMRNCQLCPTERSNVVKHICGLTKEAHGLPQICSVSCAAKFVPYYQDCVVLQLNHMNEAEQNAVHTFLDMCKVCTKERVLAVQGKCDSRASSNGTAKLSYPESCTRDCSEIYMPFFDNCLNSDPATPPEANKFLKKCKTAAEGGVAIRIRITKDMASIKDLGAFKEDLRGDVALSLKIDTARVEVTQLKSGSVIADVNILPADNADAPDPLNLKLTLQIMVANPTSLLYTNGKVTFMLDSTYGVHSLVPGTHQEDGTKPPTSLELAQAEYKRAVEGGYPEVVLDYMFALVKYHEGAEQGASAETLDYLFAVVKWKKMVSVSAPPEFVAAMKAEVDYRKAIMDKDPESHIHVLKAIRQLLRDMAASSSHALIARDEAEVEYLKIVEYGGYQAAVPVELSEYTAAYGGAETLAAPVFDYDTALAYQGSLMNYFDSIVNHADEDTVRSGKAWVNYWKARMLNLSQPIIASDKAIAEYLSGVALRLSQNELNALEAVVEYRKAIEMQQPACKIRTQAAVVAYYKAIVHGAEQELVDKLGEDVYKWKRDCATELGSADYGAGMTSDYGAGATTDYGADAKDYMGDEKVADEKYGGSEPAAPAPEPRFKEVFPALKAWYA